MDVSAIIFAGRTDVCANSRAWIAATRALLSASAAIARMRWCAWTRGTRRQSTHVFQTIYLPSFQQSYLPAEPMSVSIAVRGLPQQGHCCPLQHRLRECAGVHVLAEQVRE